MANTKFHPPSNPTTPLTAHLSIQPKHYGLRFIVHVQHLPPTTILARIAAANATTIALIRRLPRSASELRGAITLVLELQTKVRETTIRIGAREAEVVTVLCCQVVVGLEGSEDDYRVVVS